MIRNLFGFREFEDRQKKELESLKAELQDAIKLAEAGIQETRKETKAIDARVNQLSKKFISEFEQLRQPKETPAYATTRQVETLKTALDNLESRLSSLKRAEVPRPPEQKEDLEPIQSRLSLLETKLKQLTEEFDKLSNRASAIDNLNLLVNRGYQEVAVCPNCQNKGHPISFVGQMCPTCRYSKLAKGLLVVGLQEIKKK